MSACAGCGGLLSRYNLDALCTSCTRTASPPFAPIAQLWDSQPLREALASMDLASVMAIVRGNIGLTQLELASVLSWSQSTVQRIEAGTRDTLFDIRCLLSVADTLDLPREVLIPLITGNTGASSDDEVEPHDVDVSRRQFGGALAGVAAVAAGWGTVDAPSSVDMAHVRHLRAAAVDLYTKDQQVGGGTLARDGMRAYLRARHLLDESTYTDAVGRELMAVAGELAVCVGWLSYDNSDQRSAHALYSEALYIANQAGDDDLAIRALEKLSLQAVHIARESGQPGKAREAIRLSGRAGDLARRNSSPHLHALISARQALALACAGDGRGSQIALSHAWREVDGGLADRSTVPVWLDFVTPSEITVAEAKANVYLGRPEAAALLYRRSLDETLSPRNAANFRASLARCLGESGDLTSALSEATSALPALEGRITSARTMSELAPLRNELARSRRDGGDFVARFDAISRPAGTNMKVSDAL